MPCNGSEGSTPDSEPKSTASGEGGGQGPPPPPREDQTEPRFLRQLAAAPLTIGAWVLHNFPSVVLVGMLVAMLVYALANRRALRVLDLEAGNQMLALQLGHQLEAVRIGAQAGIDADACLQQAGAPPPSVSLPGTGLSIDTLLKLFQWGWLGETEVRAALVSRKDEFGRDAHRMHLQVNGPDVTTQLV